MNEIKVQPILTNVLVKPLQEKKKTEGGIYLPDTGRKIPEIGKVMAVGADVNPNIKKGKKVLFKKWETFNVPMEELGETWLMIDHENIIAILG